MNWSRITFSFTLCDLMNQCQLIVFIWRPSCLVADSASDTLTAVCPNTPHSLLLAGLAGEYYWMSIWPHYKCVATGNQLGEEGGVGRGGRTVASWDRNLTSLSLFLFFPRLSGDAHVHMCTRAHMQHTHPQPRARTVSLNKDTSERRTSMSSLFILRLNDNTTFVYGWM